MQTNASGGNPYPYGGDNMKAFDRLPKGAREALRNSDHNWSAGQVAQAYRKHPKCKTVAAIVTTIKENDKKLHDALAAEGLIMPGQR